MMFGYACHETDSLMPMPIDLSHCLARRLAQARKAQELPWLRPDGKSQVTIEYAYGRPKRIDTVLVSTQHAPGIPQAELREGVIETIIKPVLPPALVDKDLKIFVNPTGSFEVGGPLGDSGLTGRKIIVDTYGGRAPHGGGAFSGKDPSKVDRSAAYAARHVAKNIVASGLADECLMQVAYAIGVADPVSIHVNTYGTGRIPDSELERVVAKEIDMTPRGIIHRLKLLRPIYQKTAAYGHFGRDDKDFTWEHLDLVSTLQRAIR